MIILLLFIVGLIETLIAAAALESMYTWFVLPLGAPALSIAHVAGLLLMVKLATLSLPEEIQERSLGETITRSVVAMLTTGFLWLAAWIFHIAM